jgi:hypothetical protein
LDSCYGFDREMVSLRKRNNRSQAVRTGRWMARRDEPFAVFVFGIPEYALCLGSFSLVTADQ